MLAFLNYVLVLTIKTPVMLYSSIEFDAKAMPPFRAPDNRGGLPPWPPQGPLPGLLLAPTDLFNSMLK